MNKHKFSYNNLHITTYFLKTAFDHKPLLQNYPPRFPTSLETKINKNTQLQKTKQLNFLKICISYLCKKNPNLTIFFKKIFFLLSYLNIEKYLKLNHTHKNKTLLPKIRTPYQALTQNFVIPQPQGTLLTNPTYQHILQNLQNYNPSLSKTLLRNLLKNIVNKLFEKLYWILQILSNPSY